MSSHEHPADDLQLLAEGVLTRERGAEVEAHLAECPRCRRELDAIRLVRASARAARQEPELPDGLASRISASLDAEDRSARRTRRAWRLVPPVLAAAAVLVVVLLREPAPGPVEAALLDYQRYRSAALTLELTTADPTELQRFFDARPDAVRARVFDFGMMGYGLAGGRVHRLAGRDGVLFAYRNPAGMDLLCVMYAGRLLELPATGEERVHRDIVFRVYQRDGVTLVFWQEGDTTCVLVSAGAAEEAIQLAYAKAVKV